MIQLKFTNSNTLIITANFEEISSSKAILSMKIV
jgi:hypothetical protein